MPMYFGQKVHPLNFNYCDRAAATAPDGVELAGPGFTANIRAAELFDGILRLAIQNSHVADPTNYSDGVAPEHRDTARALLPADDSGREGVFHFAGSAVTVMADHTGLSIRWPGGGRLPAATKALNARSLAETASFGQSTSALPLGGLGTNGHQTILNFELGGATAAFGFGERTGRLNKLGQSFDHWNVDVAGVYRHHWQRDDFDPAYVAIPFAILRLAGGETCGLFFDNPGRVVLDVGRRLPGTLMYQSLDANTDLYLLPGPTLQDVTRRFAALTGRAELPPLWTLGHHQCRWGYASEEDFRTLARRYREHEIPNSVLWYDIDYMDEYRVFTWNGVTFPDPARLNADLNAEGMRTVAIVDPGVKLDPGYAVYDSGKAADVYCKTIGGRDYVGSVWPGDTLFPDYTLETTRAWWAEHLANWMRESNIDGAWLDMNDPSTGESSSDEMRFDHGRLPHARFHNQYAHFMAWASRLAFEKLDDAGRRPFLLTRSASTGTQRHSAVWTGDNGSNWQHLRMSIPCTLNLGLSGVAFNGPDVGGFNGNCSPELLTRWYQAGFLFPFFRNHSGEQTKSQEPWEFGPVVRRRVADVIRTRYRLLPYLYQLFWEHYLHGDPILRPLLYHFDDAGDDDHEPGLENVDDQFLLGPSLLAAPMVHSEDENHPVNVDGKSCQLRHVHLPGGAGTWWFDLNHARWVEAGRSLRYPVAADETPLFVPDGAMIPYHAGPLDNARTDFSRAVELHVFLKDKPSAEFTYHVDDQQSRAYLLRGKHNRASLRSGRDTEGKFFFTCEETGPLPSGSVEFHPVYYGGTGAEENAAGNLRSGTRRWIGRDVPVLAA